MNNWGGRLCVCCRSLLHQKKNNNRESEQLAFSRHTHHQIPRSPRIRCGSSHGSVSCDQQGACESATEQSHRTFSSVQKPGPLKSWEELKHSRLMRLGQERAQAKGADGNRVMHLLLFPSSAAKSVRSRSTSTREEAQHCRGRNRPSAALVFFDKPLSFVCVTGLGWTGWLREQRARERNGARSKRNDMHLHLPHIIRLGRPREAPTFRRRRGIKKEPVRGRRSVSEK